MKIVITGPKCSGKSPIGRLLSQRVSLPFFETDEIIEQLFTQETGKALSCRAICSEYGEDFFRNYERRAVKQVVQYDSCVISTGGSTLLDKDSKELLRKGSVLVLLYASAFKLLERVSKKGFPAFLKDKKNPQDLFVAMANLVVETLKPFADIVIDSSEMDLDKTLNVLITNLRGIPELASIVY
jgi:shikimate kinase